MCTLFTGGLVGRRPLADIRNTTAQAGTSLRCDRTKSDSGAAKPMRQSVLTDTFTLRKRTIHVHHDAKQQQEKEGEQHRQPHQKEQDESQHEQLHHEQQKVIDVEVLAMNLRMTLMQMEESTASKRSRKMGIVQHNASDVLAEIRRQQHGAVPMRWPADQHLLAPSTAEQSTLAVPDTQPPLLHINFHRLAMKRLIDIVMTEIAGAIPRLRYRHPVPRSRPSCSATSRRRTSIRTPRTTRTWTIRPSSVTARGRTSCRG